jgi:predicted nucleic acid-binding protein
MGERYLIDTNVVIDYLENKLPLKASDILDKTDIQISVISRMEILAWPKATETQLEILNGFINASSVLGLNEPIIIKAIEIRKNHRVKLPDAIIASTAIINGFILLTRNTNDFGKIEELSCTDPYKL